MMKVEEHWTTWTLKFLILLLSKGPSLVWLDRRCGTLKAAVQDAQLLAWYACGVAPTLSIPQNQIEASSLNFTLLPLLILCSIIGFPSHFLWKFVLLFLLQCIPKQALEAWNSIFLMCRSIPLWIYDAYISLCLFIIKPLLLISPEYYLPFVTLLYFSLFVPI